MQVSLTGRDITADTHSYEKTRDSVMYFHHVTGHVMIFDKIYD